MREGVFSTEWNPVTPLWDLDTSQSFRPLRTDRLSLYADDTAQNIEFVFTQEPAATCTACKP